MLDNQLPEGDHELLWPTRLTSRPHTPVAAGANPPVCDGDASSTRIVSKLHRTTKSRVIFEYGGLPVKEISPKLQNNDQLAGQHHWFL
jgi:hypothetical protein